MINVETSSRKYKIHKDIAIKTIQLLHLKYSNVN